MLTLHVPLKLKQDMSGGGNSWRRESSTRICEIISIGTNPIVRLISRNVNNGKIIAVILIE